jgi:hypothetical protein
VLGTLGSFPTGVSCTLRTQCTAVGYHNPPSAVTVTLAERWNGTKWAVESTPHPPHALISYLVDVSCPAAHDCLAVGYTGDSVVKESPLSEAWNGTHWTLLTTPKP